MIGRSFNRANFTKRRELIYTGDFASVKYPVSLKRTEEPILSGKKDPKKGEKKERSNTDSGEE